jgi:hypothetical protein
MRPANVLWSSEGGKVLLVDFERSEILKQAPALQEISPNKRRLSCYVPMGLPLAISHHA